MATRGHRRTWHVNRDEAESRLICTWHLREAVLDPSAGLLLIPGFLCPLPPPSLTTHPPLRRSVTHSLHWSLNSHLPRWVTAGCRHLFLSFPAFTFPVTRALFSSPSFSFCFYKLQLPYTRANGQHYNSNTICMVHIST